MLIDPTTCYAALRARDRRFDGVFFVAVKTTGIYCRPICPARTPGRDRCEFYAAPAEAERAGYRACFRCRPELAPGHAPIDAPSAHVRSALARIDAGFLNTRSVDDLAGTLGVTARHLRRAMETELGVSPVELAQTRRLALAKQLLHDTSLSLTDIALAAGFSSIRRFNAAFLERFGRPPSQIRVRRSDRQGSDALRIRLDYRPPYGWAGLLSFLATRAIPGVEAVSDGTYQRTVRFGDRSGVLAVRARDQHLEAEIPSSLAPHLMEIVSRLRPLFDLDARPDLINETLRTDPVLRTAVRKSPGLRVPGAFEGFEIAVRAVLGQQVSVLAARTLGARLVQRFGTPVQGAVESWRLFPAAATLAEASLEDVRAIGLPGSRAQTLIDLSRAVASQQVRLDRSASPEETIARLQEIRGIGPWTAQYVTMRALRWPDAFPAGDLGVLKALGITSARAAETRSERWRPWRSYAVLHLWSSA